MPRPWYVVTRDEEAALRALDLSHRLDHCPFVEAIKASDDHPLLSHARKMRAEWALVTPSREVTGRGDVNGVHCDDCTGEFDGR